MAHCWHERGSRRNMTIRGTDKALVVRERFGLTETARHTSQQHGLENLLGKPSAGDDERIQCVAPGRK
jgi:hypothetical protein